MSIYSARPVDAPWLNCQVCGRAASLRLQVSPETQSKRGSRGLGYYCYEHGHAKLTSLRTNSAVKKLKQLRKS